MVGELDGRPAGMASGLLPDDGPVQVLSMWVAPFARGQGVADTLVESILAWAGQCRPGQVVLSVREDNPAAIALHVRHGFVDVGPEPLDPEAAPERHMMRGILE